MCGFGYCNSNLILLLCGLFQANLNSPQMFCYIEQRFICLLSLYVGTVSLLTSYQKFEHGKNPSYKGVITGIISQIKHHSCSCAISMWHHAVYMHGQFSTGTITTLINNKMHQGAWCMCFSTKAHKTKHAFWKFTSTWLK